MSHTKCPYTILWSSPTVWGDIISALGMTWLIKLNGNGGCRRQQPTGGLTAQVDRLDLLGAVLHASDEWGELTQLYDHSTLNIIIFFIFLFLIPSVVNIAVVVVIVHILPSWGVKVLSSKPACVLIDTRLVFLLAIKATNTSNQFYVFIGLQCRPNNIINHTLYVVVLSRWSVWRNWRRDGGERVPLRAAAYQPRPNAASRHENRLRHSALTCAEQLHCC